MGKDTKIKQIISLLLGILIICSICSCKRKEDTVEDRVDVNVEKKAVELPYNDTNTDTTKTREKENKDDELKHLSADDAAEENRDYISLYMSKIDELHSSGLAYQLALVNVNGDDIPKLAACNSIGPGSDNTFLYTFYDNDTILLESGAAGFDGYRIEFGSVK